MSYDFATLWNHYPFQPDQESLFNSLGGGWPALIGNPAFANTCTIRLSVALIGSNINIPDDLCQKDGGLKDADGNNMIIRVPTAKILLDRIFGMSDWGISKQVGADIDGQVPNDSGIFLYTVPPPSDANGHVDLWNKTHCTIDCHNEYARAATSVELWKVV